MRSIIISPLEEYPDVLGQIGRWYYDCWGHEHSDRSLEIETERLHRYLRPTGRERMWLAHLENDLAGVVQLKRHEIPSPAAREWWIGGVYVDEPFRGQGLAARLVDHAVAYASKQGITDLYLQTESLDGGLYGRMGWKPLERVVRNGNEVLVMSYHLR